MPKAKVIKLDATSHEPRSARARKQAAPALAPGIHLGRIEMLSGAVYSVSVGPRRSVMVELAEGFEAAFAEECLREQRPVIVSVDEDGRAVLAGALQTTRGVSRDREGSARIEATRLDLRAEEGATIAVGRTLLRIDRRGAVKIVGDKMTLDITEVVRVLSARCELP